MLTNVDLNKIKSLVSSKNILSFFKDASLKELAELAENEGRRELMDTFGNLIDKLITVNTKMWHTQEILYEIRRMTPEQFEEKYGKDLKGLHKLLDRACNLNVQRAQLMDEIDRFLVESIKQDPKEADNLLRPQHKIY